MKMKYIISIIVLIIIVGGIIFYMQKMNNEEDFLKVEIKSLYLSYSRGYMMNANIRYKFFYDKKTDKYMVMVKPYLIDEDDELEVEVDNQLKDKLKDILVKYEVNKWDGFNKSDQNVLDGDSFSFGVNFDNDTSISASGYMMWPKNYREVVNELDNIFMDIYNQYK